MERERLSVNQYWKFFRGEPPKMREANSDNPHSKGVPPFAANYNDAEWGTVHLPHTVRVEKLNCSGGFNYQGECWYRKKFFIDENRAARENYFQFDGAMQRVDAWLDGKPLGVAYGGYLPVKLDLSGITAGEHTLALKVDNSDMKDVPPGKPQGELDFCYFGGLYRNAWFISANKVRFSDAVHEGKPASGGLFVRTFVSGGEAAIRVRANWLNHTEKTVSAKIRLLLDGQTVYESEPALAAAGGDADVDCEFTIDNPRLWHPNTPELYTLTALLLDGESVLDEKKERIGIRSVEFTPEGFFINGEKLFLNGVNRHQEYAYIGNALSDSLQVRDVKLMRAMGANCIRTGHYPPDEVFLSACDQEGILCVIPTPGWQWYPMSVAFDEACYENTRRMIRLLRNHPSALLWEPILNETDYPEYFAKKQLEIAQEEYGDLKGLCACDWCGKYAENYPVNYTNGKVKTEKPEFVREYGDFYMEQYGPMKTLRRVRRGENTGFYPGGERAMIRSAQERFDTYVHLRENSSLSGAAVWAAIDHNRGYEPTEGAVGMFDFLRFPKFYYYLFDCQQDIEQVGVKCFIANYWTEWSPRDVVVYTNAEQVRLLVCGKEIGIKDAQGQTWIHPPVVFENVPFEKGKLVAEALVGGKAEGRYEVNTPGAPKKLVLKAHYVGVEDWTADGSDLMMVHVSVVDENGFAVYSAEPDVTFAVEGDAEIVGKDETWVQADKITLEAGKGGVLLRAGLAAGEVVVRAFADNLETAELVLYTDKNERKYLPCVCYSKTGKSPVYDCDRKTRFSVPVSIRDEKSDRWDIGAEKAAAASSSAKGYGAENANRKKIGDAWIAESPALPQWWMVELGEEYCVNGLSISWEKDGLWYDYEVETSMDGETFECRYNGHASGQTRLPNRFAGPVKAKYLRIVITGVSGQEAVGIYHVELFGNK